MNLRAAVVGGGECPKKMEISTPLENERMFPENPWVGSDVFPTKIVRSF